VFQTYDMARAYQGQLLRDADQGDLRDGAQLRRGMRLVQRLRASLGLPATHRKPRSLSKKAPSTV
jgi:hypothetical protein